MKSSLFASVLGLVGASHALAQTPTVIVKVFDDTNAEITSMAQSVAAGSNVTVTFASPISATRTIRIYDSGTVGTSSSPTIGMGTLKVVGSATATGRLNVLIGDGDQFRPPATSTAFPATVPQANAINAGLTDFGGTLPGTGVGYGDQSHDFDNGPFPSGGTDTLPSTSGFPGWNDTGLRGLIIPDPRLRRQTVAAIVVSNDICPGGNDGSEPTGRIEAGHILRVAALGTVSGTNVIGGNINAHIIADGRDTYLSYGNIASPPTPPGFSGVLATTTGFRAIESVSAGNAIRGTVTAYGRRKDDGGNEFPQDPGIEPGSQPAITQRLDKFWINRGSIGSVFIAPMSGAIDGTGTASGEKEITRGGIQNDIISKWGRIYSIRTWGPIGKPIAGVLNNVDVTAADGVLEVRGEPFASHTFDASEVNKILAMTLQSYGFDHAVQFPDQATTAGVVNLITSNGDIGPVSCLNLMDDPTRRDKLGRCGIITRGGFPTGTVDSAIVNVGLTCAAVAHNVTILAHHMGGIEIGHHFKGAIIAHGNCVDPVAPDVNYVRAAGLEPLWGGGFGGADGKIGGVKIGHIELDPLVYPETTKYVRGFVGGYGAPVDLRPTPYAVGTANEDKTPTPYNGLGPIPGPAPGLLKMSWDPDRWHFVSPTSANDGGAIDSVIHAETLIGVKYFFIYQMTQGLGLNEKEEEIVAPYKPRVESPLIMELTIGLDQDDKLGLPVRGGMFDGVVWSGLLEYTNGQVDNYNDADPRNRAGFEGLFRENDYAVIGSLHVARMSPSADIWMAQVQDDMLYHAVPAVYEDMCGEMHFDYFWFTGVLDIGGKLGQSADFTFPYHTHNCTEASPRGLAATHRSAGVLVQEPVDCGVGTVYIRGADKWLAGTGQPHDWAPLRRFDGPIRVHSKWQPSDPPVTPDHASYWTGRVVEGDAWGDVLRDLSWTYPPQYVPVPQLVLGPADVLHPENQGPFYQRRAGTMLGITFDVSTGNMVNNLDQSAGRNYGGSVGVFPLRVHAEDSKPIGNQTEALSHAVAVLPWFNAHTYNATLGLPRLATIGTPLFARFYGPIEDVQSIDGLWPVVFERKVGSSWVRVDDTFNVERTYPVEGTNPGDLLRRDLAITPVCSIDYSTRWGQYRMRQPVPADDDVSIRVFDRVRASHRWAYLSKPPTDDFAFYFRLVCSMADVGKAGGLSGSDGMLDNNDFIAFINLFFQQAPTADLGIAGGLPGSDGAWDNNDFIAFINLFYEGGCSGSVYFNCGEELGGNRPIGGGEGGGAGNRMAGNGQGSTADDFFADLREILQQMIESESDASRRAQLQEMLNSLPPSP